MGSPWLRSLPFFLGAIWALPALGDDDGAAEFRCEPTLENRDEGAFFQVTGQVPAGYPEGTNLHVSLVVEGRSRAPVRATFMKVTVQKGRFDAQFSWPGQRFGPMTYKTVVVAPMQEQVPEVRKTLVREFGWTNEHIEKLASIETDFGTLEERSGFGQQSLLELKSLVERYEAIRQKGVAALAGGDVPAVQKELEELEKALVAFKRAYVIRIEGELLQRLDSANASIFRHVRRGGDRGKAGLDQLAQELKIIVSEIEARTALKPAGELEGEGAHPPGEKPSDQEKKEERR